jgi:DNA helicase MCM8
VSEPTERVECRCSEPHLHLTSSSSQPPPPLIRLIPGDGCRGRTFVAERPSAKCIDWQKIRVQELLGSDAQQQGRVPRTVEVGWQRVGIRDRVGCVTVAA